MATDEILEMKKHIKVYRVGPLMTEGGILFLHVITQFPSSSLGPSLTQVKLTVFTPKFN